MSSIRKHPRSPFWYACFTRSDGTQTQRSTKTTDRRLALRIAEKYEIPAKRQLGEAQARKVIRDLYEIHAGEPLDAATTREFLTKWLERKQHETSISTFKKYQSVVSQFIEYLGDSARKDITLITRKHVSEFQQSIAKRLSPATANLALKILRVAFKSAFRDGLIQQSPADQIEVLANKNRAKQRRGFSPAEVATLYRHAKEEWRGLILFGFWTGQRLKDVATLTTANVDLDAAEIRLTTSKTGRRVELPLVPQLRDYVINNRLISAGPNVPLFPHAFATVKKNGAVQTLSNEFYELLVASGLAPTRSKANTGRGRSVRRATNPLSYHSFRHTLTSALKNAGISSAIVQDIIGHASPEISAHYTLIDSASKRNAINSIPLLLLQQQQD